MKKRTQGPLLIISYCVNQYVYQRAVIQATDTDIFIMAIYYSVRIPDLRELWMQKGMQLYRMSHNSEFARRDVYIASDIGLFCSSLCAHY